MIDAKRYPVAKADGLATIVEKEGIYFIKTITEVRNKYRSEY